MAMGSENSLISLKTIWTSWCFMVCPSFVFFLEIILLPKLCLLCNNAFTWVSKFSSLGQYLDFGFISFNFSTIYHSDILIYFFSLGFSWVSNGVVGSPAFAAYDQGLLYLSRKYLCFSKQFLFLELLHSFVLSAGYDVFLGNFRGLVSREHVNKNISSRQ